MKIQKLQISNFLRVKSITVEPSPDQNVVRLHGRNMQGKSSVIRALQAAFGGKKFHPPKPIHEGADEARVSVDCGELLIEVTWRDGGEKVDLVVRTADGARVRSPQAVLDTFYSKVSFDALAFVRMAPQQQVELLRQLSGVNFERLDFERAEFYAKRTDVGRDRDKAVAQGAGAPAGEAPKETTLSALTAQIQALSDAETARNIATARCSGAGQTAQAATNRMAALRKELDEAHEHARLRSAEYDAAKLAAVEAEAHLKAMGDGAALRAKLQTAEADNARARDLRAKKAKAIEGAALTKQYAELTKAIDAIDDQKQKAVAAAKLPVDGLDFTGAEVMYGGKPFSQASDREQVLISAAIGQALSPKLGALLIREGAFLDEDGWKALSAWAEDRDVQVWIEDVGVDGAGILIEDGLVVSGDPAEVVREVAGKPHAEGISVRPKPVGGGAAPPEITEEGRALAAAMALPGQTQAEAEAMLLSDDEDEEWK